MEGFLQKLKNHKIVLFCIALFLVALIMVIFIATRSTPAPKEPENTSTDAESTTIETTTEETTTVPPETTTEETTTVPPETQTVHLSDYDQISEGSLYGYLSCEKIGLNCSVYMGDDSYDGSRQDNTADRCPQDDGLCAKGDQRLYQYAGADDLYETEAIAGRFSYKMPYHHRSLSTVPPSVPLHRRTDTFFQGRYLQWNRQFSLHYPSF